MLSKSLNSSGSQHSWIQDNSAYGDKIFYSGHGHGLLHFAFPTTPAEVSSVKDLFDFKCSGPLVDNLGLTPEKVAGSIDKWLLYGSKLCRLFQLDEWYLTEPQKV